MQFQVPQFIETEDKIIGPFTLRQFLYVGAAGAISFVLFFATQLWLWALGTIFLLAIAGGLAFIKIEGRSLPHIIGAALNFYWKPQTYLWQPEHPETKKEAEVRAEVRKDVSLEDIISGAAIRSAWRKLQTGETRTKITSEQFLESVAKYQIFQKISGERRAARRVDYR